MHTSLRTGQVEVGKHRHDQALEQAKAAAKTHYSLIYDVNARLHFNLNKGFSTSKPQLKPTQPLPLNAHNAELVNYIVTLTQLLQGTQDLKAGLAEK